MSRASGILQHLYAKWMPAVTEFNRDAPEAKRRRESVCKRLAERAKALAAELRSLSRSEGRDMTRDEIDEMWGHS